MKTKKNTEQVDEDFIIESPAGDSSEEWDAVSDSVPRSVLGAPSKDRAASRPDISKLPNGIGTDGIPTFVRGDKVVIERYSGILRGHPYLDTRTYVIQSIDVVTGKITMYDAAQGQFATDNWKAGLKNGNVYKLAKNTTIDLSSKRKRGRPRKNPDAPTNVAIKPVPIVDINGMPVAKKRGRPAGSKNRPKEIIMNEKRAKKDARFHSRYAYAKVQPTRPQPVAKADTTWIFLQPMNDLLKELTNR